MPTTTTRKTTKEVPAHPTSRVQERVQHSHDLKKATTKPQVLPKRFSSRSLGNR
jgi:hypothetical protein